MSAPHAGQLAVLEHRADLAIVVPLFEDEQRQASLDQRLVGGQLEQLAQLPNLGLGPPRHVAEHLRVGPANDEHVGRLFKMGLGVGKNQPPVLGRQLHAAAR